MEFPLLVKQHGGKYRRIICKTLSTNFRQCTQIMQVNFPKSLRKDEVVVENYYLGINASDINFTNGRYIPNAKPPFPCGFEAIGKVRAVGNDVKKLKIGDVVVVSSVFGAFSDFMFVHEKNAIKVPFMNANILPMIVCGLTASIALEHVGEMKHGETVMVTASA